MKIAVLSHLKYPIAEPFYGGLEMHTHMLVRQLMERGHQVDIFALPDSDPAFNIRPLERGKLRMNTGKDLFEGPPEFTRDFLDLQHTYLNAMLDIRDGGYDLVHNNCLHYLPPAMAHTLPCPMVTILHTPPFPSLQSGILTGSRCPNNRYVAISDHSGQTWLPYARRYRVIHNGIEVDRWPLSNQFIPETAIWMGRICPEKGTHLAIVAARKAGFRLRIAGAVYDQDYYEKEVLPLLGPDIKLLGHLTHAELAREIGRSQVGLFTSTWEEPFGLVLAEIMACGTPVAAFDSGAARELVGEGCGTVVTKGDTDALARAMVESRSLSRADCRRHVEEHFSVRQMIDGYESLYAEVVRMNKQSTLTRSA